MPEKRVRRSSIAAWALALAALVYQPSLAAGQVFSIEQANKAIEQGNAAFERGHGEEAIALWRQALQTARIRNDANAQMVLLEKLGTTAGLIHKPADAVTYLVDALNLAQKLGNRQQEERILPELAENAEAAKNVSITIDAYRALLARAKASGNRSMQALDSGILGATLLEAGQADAAIPPLQDASALFIAEGQRREAVIAFLNLGSALERQERYVEAANAYERAAAIGRQIEERSSVANALRGLGNARRYLGDYVAAVDALQKGRTVAQRSGDRETEASILMSLGNVKLKQGDTAKAIEYWKQTLSIARSLNDKDFESKALGNLAIALMNLEQFDKAEQYYRQDITAAHERADRLAEAQALGNFGRMRMIQKVWADAIPLLKQSADLAHSSGYRRAEAIALEDLGRAQLHAKQLAAAENSLRDAVAIFEEIRDRSSGKEASDITLLDEHQSAYRVLQAVFVAENKLEAALEASERGRARALANLFTWRDGSATAASPLSIDDIRSVAETHRVTLVEYSIIETVDDPAGSAVYVWVVQPDGTVTFRRIAIQSNGSALQSSLHGLVRDTLATLGPGKLAPAKPGIAGAEEMLSIFYSMLLAPVADTLPSSADEAVVLIPQGPLFLLPFAALRDGNGKRLIQSHSLLMAPSIQMGSVAAIVTTRRRWSRAIPVQSLPFNWTRTAILFAWIRSQERKPSPLRLRHCWASNL